MTSVHQMAFAILKELIQANNIGMQHMTGAAYKMADEMSELRDEHNKTQ